MKPQSLVDNPAWDVKALGEGMTNKEATMVARYARMLLQQQPSTPPPPSTRWTFVMHVDGVTHRVLADRFTKWSGSPGREVPMRGITECGLRTVAAVLGHENGNFADALPVTCIACASGTCTWGKALYNHDKAMAFGAIYGRRIP